VKAPLGRALRNAAARGVVAWACGAAALLAGCASAPPPSPDALSGRLAVTVAASAQQPARSVSAGFELRGGPERGQLQLTSPLGTVVAQAHWQPGEVVLQSSDGERRFPTLSALSQEVLGEALPLDALFDWLRGRPWAGAPSVAAGDGFEQLGWQVSLAQWADGTVSARRAAPPEVTVRARVAR
jgi:outer membrane lipoprotein LolB